MKKYKMSAHFCFNFCTCKPNWEAYSNQIGYFNPVNISRAVTTVSPTVILPQPYWISQKLIKNDLKLQKLTKLTENWNWQFTCQKNATYKIQNAVPYPVVLDTKTAKNRKRNQDSIISIERLRLNWTYICPNTPSFIGRAWQSWKTSFGGQTVL